MGEETLTLVTEDNNYYDEHTVLMVQGWMDGWIVGHMLDCAVYISHFECNIVTLAWAAFCIPHVD